MLLTRFAARIRELVHARCWSHARRYFVKAEAVEPELSNTALDFIADLYAQEATIRKRGWSGAKKLEARAQYCKPVVDRFFAWLAEAHHQNLLLPANPFTRAAHYTLDREDKLQVFLEDADVPLDTNGLEREIRPIAIGRKNRLFSWTEIGAEHLGIMNPMRSDLDSTPQRSLD